MTKSASENSIARSHRDFINPFLQEGVIGWVRPHNPFQGFFAHVLGFTPGQPRNLAAIFRHTLMTKHQVISEARNPNAEIPALLPLRPAGGERAGVRWGVRFLSRVVLCASSFGFRHSSNPNAEIPALLPLRPAGGERAGVRWGVRFLSRVVIRPS